MIYYNLSLIILIHYRLATSSTCLILHMPRAFSAVCWAKLVVVIEKAEGVNSVTIYANFIAKFA